MRNEKKMTTNTIVKEHLIVALDTSNETEAIKLVEKLSGYVGYFKIGLELFTAYGPRIIQAIKDTENKIFFDGKFLDIPNTVSKAVYNMVRHRVDMLNVYMSGGAVMLTEAKQALVDSAQEHNLQLPKLLGVTVLTSLTSDVLQNDLKIQDQSDEYVLHLAKLAFKNNLDGIICSPHEAKLMTQLKQEAKKLNKEFLIVTPGVRPSWADKNDQERIATPKDALTNGATHIVVGRPITSATNPLDAVKKIYEEIQGVEIKK